MADEKNDIAELRGHLFATLKALQDPANPMDIERAKAIADVAGRVIDTAKVEVQYMNVAGGKGTGFIPEAPRALPRPDSHGGRRQ